LKLPPDGLALPVVGLYIEQICLTCLLLLKAKQAGFTAIIEAIFMIILIILTACAQMLIHDSFGGMSFFFLSLLHE